MRICSFLPSATEIIFDLGLEDELYGVTHECDYPARAKKKPRLTASALPQTENSRGIDESVRSALRSGEPIYSLNYEALVSANPDIIFTQELCEVCAVPYGEIYRAASKLPKVPEIVSLDTFTLKDILDSIIKVGSICGRKKESEEFVSRLDERIEKATQLASASRSRSGKKKVFFMEWIDPVMSGGHWMAELIMRAGGDDIFATHGKNSRRVDWAEIIEYAPDFLIISPCGFGVKRAEEESKILQELDAWEVIPAVQNHNVFVVDGNAYYSRPGPRIVDGLEMLTVMLNPTVEEYKMKYNENDYKRIF